MTNQNQQLAKQEQAMTPTFDLFNPVTFDLAQRMANMYSRSDLVPKQYQASQGNEQKAVANIMIALETAQRIGASPLMVMQNMYIVYGQPAWSSKFLIATVNSCGRYNSLKYKFENLGKIKVTGTNQEVDNWECIAYTTEKGSDEIMESIPVSIDMAIKEGWYTKNGTKWQTMPKLMLQYRTATFWTRAYAPELSMGLKTDDEVYDIVNVPYEEVPANVEDKVNQEIKNHANSETLNMGGSSEPAPSGDNTQGEDNQTTPPANNGQSGRQPSFL
jgi:hypothetical protein